MKLVLQRVAEAAVEVDGATAGSIGRGLLVFLCVEKGDTADVVRHYAAKVSDLRIFPDEAGKMNRSVMDAEGGVLVISQFTLAADAEKGRRPSFDRAAPPELAVPLYELFAEEVRRRGIPVATGVFGAYMRVRLLNDGPVTILLGRH